jgi:DNA-binding MarR family transcriptional regulator
MHSPALHTANVLGAVVDVLGRELEAASAASASGAGGRAAAVTALAAFASGSPIDRLAFSLGLSHSRVVRLVDQLERDGHVTRARGTPDRRTVHVTLTESGWRLARRITTARLALLREEVEALGADDRGARSHQRVDPRATDRFGAGRHADMPDVRPGRMRAPGVVPGDARRGRASLDDDA